MNGLLVTQIATIVCAAIGEIVILTFMLKDFMRDGSWNPITDDDIKSAIRRNETRMKFMEKVDKELLEQIQDCIDDAVENVRDGYQDIAEDSLRDAAYLLYQIEDEQLREQVAASLEINPLDYGQ